MNQQSSTIGKAGKYWLGGDVIRVIAILGVLVIHAIPAKLNTAIDLSWAWWSTNVTQSLCIWAVPAFFMISGMLLLELHDPQETWSDFYQKRLYKVGIPLLVWSCIYIPLELRWDKSKTPAKVWHDFLIGHISWHLYFLCAIIGLYILTPWLRLWLAKLSQAQERIIIMGIFSLLAILEIFQAMNGIFFWNIAIRWIPFLGYYLFGHYFSRYQSTQISVAQYLGLFGIGLIGNVISKYVECSSSPIHPSIFLYSTNYNSVTTIPLAIGCFGVLVYMTKSVSEQSLLAKWCNFLTPSVFGIYLIHVLILRELHHDFVLPDQTNGLTCLIEAILIFPLCLLSVYLLGLTPFLGSAVGFDTLRTLKLATISKNYK